MQVKQAPGSVPSHYERVSTLHMSAAQFGKDTQKELLDVLQSKKCILRMLDVSNTQIEADSLVAALGKNSSLHSIDVRMVPQLLAIQLLCLFLRIRCAPGKLGL